ncbi:unnamed protein product [Closterium sp. NIES-54]
MASQHLVLGLRRVFASLPPSPAPPCTPCVTGHLRATPHSSSLRPATAPFQTLHLDVWGVGPTLGPERDRYFLVVVDDYSSHVRCLHSDCEGEFCSGILAGFCGEQGIRQSWTLSESPQQKGVVECRIGLVMDIARTSVIHAHAPHFLWPYTLRYASHQLNIQPRVSRPEVSPTSLWTGSPGVGSAFHFLDSCDIRLDESVSYYTWYPCRGLPVPPPPLFLAPSHPPAPAPPVPPPPPGPAPSVVSHATPPLLVARQVASPSSQSSSQSLQQPSALPRQVTMDSVGIGAGGAAADGTRSGGARSRGAGARGASAVGASSGGAGAGGSGTGGASSGGTGAGGAGTEETGAGGSPTERPHRHDTRFQTLRRLEREE